MTSLRRRILTIAGLLSLPVLAGLGVLWAFTPWITPAGPGRWRLGSPDRFPKGATFLRRARAIVVRDENGLHALSAVCTHQNCTVKPRNARKVIACPCHGASFHFDGSVRTGPAPLPLPRLALVEEGGTLFLDTTRPPESGQGASGRRAGERARKVT